MSADKPQRLRSDQRSGRAAEALVEAYLLRKGFKILDRNYTFPKIGELDIVAEKEGVICFVEVRSRQSDRLGSPAETVGPRKQRQLRKLATLYLARKNSDKPARFDVASIVWNEGDGDLDYIEDAFW